MLLNQRTLDAIVSGEIGRVYRRWKRPAVVVGTRQRTSHGLIEVTAVRPIAESEIDAKAAEFASVDLLLAALRPAEPDRVLYEVGVRWAGEDPRVGLRDSSDLDEEAFGAIDRVVSGVGRQGPPTGIELLRLIEANPATLAQDLADMIKAERDILKRRVRLLKEVGLTESLRVGYRLSPRGEAYLRRRR